VSPLKEKSHLYPLKLTLHVLKKQQHCTEWQQHGQKYVMLRSIV